MASPPVIPLRTQGRSRVFNNSTLWLDERAVDGRSKAARRFRDIYAQIVEDLGGDEGRLSEGQRQIARRCAMLSVSAELAEAAAVAGEAFDAESYGVVCDRLGRAFQRLGLKRVKRDREPTLAEIILGYQTKNANASKPQPGKTVPPETLSCTERPFSPSDDVIEAEPIECSRAEQKQLPSSRSMLRFNSATIASRGWRRSTETRETKPSDVTPTAQNGVARWRVWRCAGG